MPDQPLPHGPYIAGPHRQIGVLTDNRTHAGGKVRLDFGYAPHTFHWFHPSELEPCSRWPAWFPFQSADIPEPPKPTPKIGEFWETSDWGTVQVIGVHLDRVRILFDDVDGILTIRVSYSKLLAPADRPNDWPL